jgi:flagellar protein FlaG
MDTKVAAIAPAPESQRPQPSTVAPPARSEPPVAKGPDLAETRLVIEMDQASGAFVYKTVNRLTGEVVRQLPRAEVLKLRDAGLYEAGVLIRTNV